jgi:hypothetical protein
VEIRTIKPFLDYFGNVRERTMRVARCIPPDKNTGSAARWRCQLDPRGFSLSVQTVA